MSEEQICTGCGKPLENCICVRKPTEVIEVRHTGLPKNLGSSPTDPSTAELQEKLNERESQLQVIALRKLEGDVEQWASVVPDEKKRKAIVDSIMQSEDPVGDFERKKEMLGLFKLALKQGGIEVTGDDDTETPPPAGDARGPPARGTLWRSGEEAIDKIYRILENPKSTEQEKALARKKADEMVESFIQGRRKAIREDPRHRYHFAYTMCPKCGGTIPLAKGDKRATDCPKCGAILTKRLK